MTADRDPLIDPPIAPLIIAAAGDGEFAVHISAAGVDRIIAYHSSAYRKLGLPSVAGLLPWASANEQTLAMLPSVVHAAGPTPVLATVCAGDGLRRIPQMLQQIGERGARGVLNAPTAGLITGPLRAVLEAEQLGQDAEVSLVIQAREMGLEAWAYVFDPDWVRAAASAGATGLIIHLGITGYPSLGSFPDPTSLVMACLDTAHQVNPRTPVLLHGGDIARPDDLALFLKTLPDHARSQVRGFFGASAFERHPDTRAAVAGWRAAFTVDQQPPLEKDRHDVPR